MSWVSVEVVDSGAGSKLEGLMTHSPSTYLWSVELDELGVGDNDDPLETPPPQNTLVRLTG